MTEISFSEGNTNKVPKDTGNKGVYYAKSNHPVTHILRFNQVSGARNWVDMGGIVLAFEGG